MSAYTKPIIRYGLITPAAFNCMLLVAVVMGVGELEETRNTKEKAYKQHELRTNVMKKIEAIITPNRKMFEHQKSILKTEPGQIFTRILDATLPKYRDIELVRTNLVFPGDRGRLGSQVKSDLARVKSSFQGGTGPMQEVLLQVESLMPQTMLEEMKIGRKSNLVSKREFLEMELTHVFWKTVEDKK